MAGFAHLQDHIHDRLYSHIIAALIVSLSAEGQAHVLLGIIGIIGHGVIAAIADTQAIFLVLVEDAHGAVLQLRQAGVHKLGIVGGYIHFPNLRHGTIGFSSEGKNLAVQALGSAAGIGAGTVGTGGAGHQDHLLAVDGLAVGNGGNLAVGVGSNARAHRVSPGLVVHIVVHIAQLAGAVAVEEPQSTVLQFHNRTFRTPGRAGEIGGPGPAAAAVIGVNKARLLGFGAAVVAVDREQDHPAFRHQSPAGANQADHLILGLQIQQGGLRPGGTLVRGLGQVQIAGGNHLESGIGEEQIAFIGLVAIAIHGIQVKVRIHVIPGLNRAVGGLDGIAVQIIAIAGVVVIGQKQLSGIVEANIGLRCSLGAIAIEGDAVGIQIHQHVDGIVGSHRQGRVNEGSGTAAVVCIAIIAQIVGEGIVPVRAVIGRSGNDGIQTAAVIGGIPAGIRGGDQRAVAEGYQRGNPEAVAAGSSLGEGFAGSLAIRRLGCHVAGNRIGVRQDDRDILPVLLILRFSLFLGFLVLRFGFLLGSLVLRFGFLLGSLRYRHFIRSSGVCRGFFIGRCLCIHGGFRTRRILRALRFICPRSHGQHAQQHANRQEHCQILFENVHFSLPPR